MIKIVRMVQTCEACPAQWDAWDQDGVQYYVRYRWGHLRIDRDGPRGPTVFSVDHGHPLDGQLEHDELASLTEGHFTWPDRTL